MKIFEKLSTIESITITGICNMFNSIKRLPVKTCYYPVRFNSQESLFLTNLLKRIDTVTSRAQKLEVPEDKISNRNKKLNNRNNSNLKSKKNGGSGLPIQVLTQSIRVVDQTIITLNQTIRVLNHPLRNTFNQNKDRFSKFGTSYNLVNQGEGQRQNQSRISLSQNQQGQRFGQRDGKFAQGLRPQQKVKPRQSNRPSKAKFVSEIKTKLLKAKPLQPEVNGDTFLYGKPTSVLPCTTSRVASIAKTALLDSKYPFKLPKHIIDQAPNETPNEFLLHKNWSFDLNVPKILKQVNHLVLGKADQIQLNSNDKLSFYSNQPLMKNASIDITDKQLMYDIISGTKLVKTLFAESHWVKNKPVAKVEEVKKVEHKKKGKK